MHLQAMTLVKIAGNCAGYILGVVLLAQTEIPGANAVWWKEGVAVGTLAIAVIYMLTRTIPAIVKDCKETCATIAECNTENLNKLTDTFRIEQAAARTTHENEQKATREIHERRVQQLLSARDRRDGE